jgi:hypothetical protein
MFCTVCEPKPRAVFCLICLISCGCGGGRQSADQALKEAIQAGGGQQQDIAKFAGTVTIDGEAAKSTTKTAVVVLLYDPKKPPSKATGLIYAACDKEGHFEFSTYTQGDGVPVGSYIVLFAQLNPGFYKHPGYHPPDKLLHLYDDPDKSEFKVDVTKPGKTDYDFNLKLAGRDGVTTPGPKAILDIGH